MSGRRLLSTRSWVSFSCRPQPISRSLGRPPNAGGGKIWLVSGGSRTRDRQGALAFQTTHHDLWDYDVPSSQLCTTFLMVEGADTCLNPTHQARPDLRTRPTHGNANYACGGESGSPGRSARRIATSPTQPYSVGMPTISSPQLNESDMWGLIPLDHLWCRIAFRKQRYFGDFTPPYLMSRG